MVIWVIEKLDLLHVFMNKFNSEAMELNYFNVPTKVMGR